MSELISRNQVAQMLGFAPNTIAKWAMTGAKLPVVKIGRTVRYRREDVEDLIRRSTRGASQDEDGVTKENDNLEEPNDE